MKNLIARCGTVIAVATIWVLTVSFPALAAGCGAQPGFFGIPTWYSYLQLQENPVTNTCDVVNFHVPGSFLLVALALLDIALHIAGLVAIAFVIYGGFQYVTSQGEPDKTSRARNTIIDALIGLVITFISVGLVAFLGNRLG
jgi:Type IV secretion system pilin